MATLAWLASAGGSPFSTPPRRQQGPPQWDPPSTPSPTQQQQGAAMPDLARKSARRIQRAQERMQAAVLAAEAERSETFSGRSTEDTEACHFLTLLVKRILQQVFNSCYLQISFQGLLECSAWLQGHSRANIVEYQLLLEKHSCATSYSLLLGGQSCNCLCACLP